MTSVRGRRAWPGVDTAKRSQIPALQPGRLGRRNMKWAWGTIKAGARAQGKRTAIAGPDQGMAGSTACAFGTAPGDRASLFVTTTGGIVMPLDGVVQEAKLVRLETGVTGQPVTFRSAPRR